MKIGRKNSLVALGSLCALSWIPCSSAADKQGGGQASMELKNKSDIARVKTYRDDSPPPEFTKTQSKPAGPGKFVPAELSFEGHECHLELPGDYSLQEFLPPQGKVFSFRGPARSDKNRAVFNVNIMPAGKSSKFPSEREVMDDMLRPKRQLLKNYKEQKESLFANNGHSFKGVSYSGTASDGKTAAGFVFISQDKVTFYILCAQDEEPFAKKTIPLLMQSAKGCKITK